MSFGINALRAETTNDWESLKREAEVADAADKSEETTAKRRRVVPAANSGTPAAVNPPTLEDRVSYRGAIRNGKPHGQGILFSQEGDYAAGLFSKGEFLKGTVADSNGNEFEGRFEHGLRTGEGTLKEFAGSIFKGCFANGEREGKGTVTYPDGITFEGAFHQGRLHGTGVWRRPDGKIAYEVKYFQGELKHCSNVLERTGD